MESRFQEVDQLQNGTTSDKVIQIRSVFKSGKHTIQPAFDTKSNWYAGVERLSDEEKKGKSYYVTVGEKGDRSNLNTKVVLQEGLGKTFTTLGYVLQRSTNRESFVLCAYRRA